MTSSGNQETNEKRADFILKCVEAAAKLRKNSPSDAWTALLVRDFMLLLEQHLAIATEQQVDSSKLLYSITRLSSVLLATTIQQVAKAGQAEALMQLVLPIVTETTSELLKAYLAQEPKP